MVSQTVTPSMIKVDDMQIAGNTVTYRLSHEGPVGKFLVRDSLYLKADHPLESIPRGILAVPIISFLMPLAWVTDSRIDAGPVDETFLTSLERVRGAFRKAYPSEKLAGSISATPVTDNSEWNKDKYGVLYSGGIDSLCSYLRNRNKKPSLLMINGAPDVRVEEVEFFDRIRDRLTPVLDKAGAEFHVIESNALDALDYHAVQLSVRNEKVHGWWDNFAHGLFLTGLCAPFSAYSHTGTLLIASSYTEKRPRPWGSMPESDQEIRWGGLEVVHDSFDLNKNEKIRTILVPFLKEKGWKGFPVRVCIGDEQERLASGKLNCGRCLKCLVTTLMLLENGLDPAEFDYDMRPFSPRRIRIALENGYLKIEEAPLTFAFVLGDASPVSSALEADYPGLNALMRFMKTWDRKPKEGKLRSYSKKLAPVGSQRRRLIRKVLRSDKLRSGPQRGR